MNIKAQLSVSGLERLQKEVDKYAEKLLSKQDRAIQLLTNYGYTVIKQNIYPYETYYDRDSDGRFTVEKQRYLDVNAVKENPVTYRDGITTAKLLLNGEEVAFLEFGTGVRYNSKPSPHPDGGRLGMTIGGYGKGHGNSPSWMFENENGEWVKARGIKAQMPLYKSEIAMLLQAKSIIKGVYKT